MLYATVTLELPMSESTQNAIGEAKNVHDEAQKMHPDPEDRKSFAISDIFGLQAVQHELERKTGEARAKLKAEMKGWTLRADELHMFIGANTLQYQQQFSK